ncbi:unnamed protein product [Trichobilharzia szidati]|nr:unnamed protein product [Trichobilharzia szidati]
MSESEDNSQLNFFNFGAWNSGCNMELINNDIWPLNSGPFLAHSKLSGLGLSTVNKQPEKLSGDSKFDSTNSLSWSPNNPLLRPPNKMSIWSSGLHSSEMKPSGASNPLWGNLTNQNDPLVSEDIWDSSHDPIFHMPRISNELDSWKLDHPQCLGSPTDAPTTVGDSDLVNSHRTLELPQSNNNSNSNLPDVTAMLSGLTVMPRNSDDSTAHTKTAIGSANENESTNQAFSTEQLCDRLINTNEGWGRRPIDQATPWEPLDSKLNDQINRSGITTPTPGACSSGYLSGNYKMPSQAHTSDSNVWTSEPPTGTGIWEMHYESLGGRSAAWQTESQSSVFRDMPSVAQVNPNHMMNSSLNINPRPAPQLQHNRSSDCREWEDNESRLSKNWNIGLSGPPDRNNLLWNAPIGVTDTEDQLGGSALHRRQPVTVSHPEAVWNSANTVHPSSGRPVLGGTRPILSTHNQPEVDTWDGDSSFMRSNMNPNGGMVSWDTSSNSMIGANWGNPGNSGLLNSMQTQLPSASDDIRRQHNYMGSISVTQGSDRLQVHPYSNTYRADLVKYLMSQGFKKEDAHAALIACNMEPEKALSELRERYSTNRTMTQPSEINRNYGVNGASSSSSHTGTRNGPMHQLSNDTSLSQLSLSGNNSTPSAQNHRLKQSGPCVTTQSNTNQLLSSMQPVPNSQLMRQQITQQVRSALNLPLPNPLGVQLNGNSSVGTCGGSLLGQPPPPSLSNVNLNTPIPPSTNNAHPLTGGGGGLPPTTTLGPAKNINSNINNNNTNNNRTPIGSVAAFNQNPAKRSPRQLSIINSIIDLQKKHQSIQHQLTVYHNNPALRSQPQYADVFVELQGQMQQIETQLHAKRAQLNLARTQEPGAQSVVRPPLLPPNGTDVADNSFPAIGTWMSPSPNCGENFDKTLTDGPGSKSNHFSRTGTTGKASNNNNNNSSGGNNWSPTWSTSVNNTTNPTMRTNHAQWQQHQQANNSNSNNNNSNNNNSNNNNCQIRPNLDNNINFPVVKNNSLGNLHGANEMQGQWLLVQPLIGLPGPSIHNLQNILSTHFKLTSFHVLNPNTNSVLIRLHTMEETMQLIKTFGDRLALEPLSDLDARVHLQQISLNTCSDGLTSSSSNQYNALSDMHTNWNNTTTMNNNNNGQFYALNSINNNNNNSNKKPNHQISRFGITVCGNK